MSDRPKQCKAITLKGTRCRRGGRLVGGFCHVHADQGAPQYRPFTPEWWAYHRARRRREERRA